VHEVVGRNHFEFVIGIVILANTLTLGIDSQLDLTDSSPAWLQTLEHCFLAIYVTEVLMRLVGLGFHACWRS